MWMKRCVVAGLLVGAPGMVRADFTYQETTQITGGAIVGMMKLAGAFSKQARQAGEPIVSTVVIQGNRMARIQQDHTEIVDLDKETITEMDNVKHQFTVVTFEQMKQQIDAAVAKAKQEQAKSQPAAAAPEQPPATVDVDFTVKVRQTGAAKAVAGVNAQESILTMTVDATDKASGQMGALAITNDMWMAAEIPGYGEVRDFYKRYAVKMGRVLSGAINPQMLAMQPGAGKGMAEMAKEMSKLKGTPVLQVMRMGSTVNGVPLPAASEAPLPQVNTPAMPSVGDVAQQSATSAIASRLGGLGGLGGFGRKKKDDPPPAAAPDSGQAAAQVGPSVLVESQTQLTSFSSTADASRFAVPPGFKQVEPRTVN